MTKAEGTQSKCEWCRLNTMCCLFSFHLHVSWELHGSAINVLTKSGWHGINRRWLRSIWYQLGINGGHSGIDLRQDGSSLGPDWDHSSHATCTRKPVGLHNVWTTIPYCNDLSILMTRNRNRVRSREGGVIGCCRCLQISIDFVDGTRSLRYHCGSDTKAFWARENN